DALPPPGGIALLQLLLVRHGLLLHVLDIERPAAPLVGVENRIGSAAQHTVEQAGQVPGFVDAAVEPEPADRVVDVRGIAAEKYPPLAELFCNTLMNVIEIQVLPIRAGGIASRQPSPHRVVRERFLVALV